MGWGLSHNDAAARALTWLVRCDICDNALPIEGSNPPRNRCAKKSGDFDTREQRFCNEHPTTRMRKKLIEDLAKTNRGA